MKKTITGDFAVLFDLGGRRMAIAFAGPDKRPEVPAGATNITWAWPSEYRAYTRPATLMEARAAFLQGWISSGADPAKAEAFFKRLSADAPAKQREEIPYEPTDDQEVPFY